MQNIAQAVSIRGLINATGGVIRTLIIIAIGMAVLVFFWGLAKFIFRIGGDEKAVAEGKRLMIWGVIALFVMVSVIGIISFMQQAFGLPDTTFPAPPSDIPNINPFNPPGTQSG
ncbi:MAG: hypothetical protein HYS51_00845 [Candidatus Zambryskibacteria bacterium]|nr:hypothetical protein [Candidatus Zambryskibacteria bacterium]